MVNKHLCMVCGSDTSGSVLVRDTYREWLCFRCYLWGWHDERIPTFTELDKTYKNYCEGRYFNYSMSTLTRR